MEESNSKDNYEAKTLILNDSNDNELFCYLEQLVNIEGEEYALLTPVDTPVSLFKINEKDEPELIEKIEKNEQILKNADAVLQEHDLRLIRSAVTLTVSGELEEPIYDELEEDHLEEDSETYELLVSFNVLAALDIAPNGADKIPGANPAKCPKFLNIASYSLSGVSPTLAVVKPSKNPEPKSLIASIISKSPS